MDTMDGVPADGPKHDGLTDRDQQILAFEQKWWKHAGSKEQAIREKFQKVVPRELERINEIVDRLLELARPERLHFTTVQLPALLEGVIELYGNELSAVRNADPHEVVRCENCGRILVRTAESGI